MNSNQPDLIYVTKLDMLAMYQLYVSCQAPAVQRETLKFSRVSRSRVSAYYASAEMDGVAEKLAAKLKERLSGTLATQLKNTLEQSKSSPVEHGVLGVILDTLAGQGGPYMFLHHLAGKHLQGLLTSMGRDPANMRSSQCEKVILQLWADSSDQVCFLHSACTTSQFCWTQSTCYCPAALLCFLSVLLICLGSLQLKLQGVTTRHVIAHCAFINNHSTPA